MFFEGLCAIISQTRALGGIHALRILHYLPWAGYGGCERSVLNLCRGPGHAEAAVLTKLDGPFLREFANSGIPASVVTDKSAVGRLADWANLVHVHGMYFPEIREGLDLAEAFNRRALVTLQGRSILPFIDFKIATVSQELFDLQNSLNDVTLIPNGVDLKVFDYKRPPERDKFVVGRVCRPGRGAAYFTQAMERVISRVDNAEIWIVGETGFSNRHFRYFGTRSDIPELLSEIDVFSYNPIPEFAAHDNCVLEAMAVGAPPVATDVAGVRESISHFHDGLLVPFGDSDAFADQVIDLFYDTTLRTRLSRNARRSVETKFDISLTIDRYRELYESVMEGVSSSAKA
jgi:glycosyltransferase involved in cell wall biosynthesis